MPLDLLSLLEAIGQVSQLIPLDYEGKYRTVATATVSELRSALDASSSRSPFKVTIEEQQRFKAAKTNLVKLVSNPPDPSFPLHAALKSILPGVLQVSRGMSTGALTKEEALALVHQLNSYAVANDHA
jgi:hypothetical protein